MVKITVKVETAVTDGTVETAVTVEMVDHGTAVTD